MKYIMVGMAGAVATAVLGGAVHAGGLERTDQSVSILFKSGRLLEFGYIMGMPDVSGVGVLATPGVSSGEMAEDFSNIRIAFKDDINDSLSYALIYDQPYGSDVAYPTSAFFASNANADLTTHQLTGVLQYNLPSDMGAFGGQFSVFAGARAQLIEASANVPFLNGYAASTESKVGYGYLAGFAWERPEYGMRVSLTYSSEIQNDLATQESFAGAVPVDTITAVDTPEALTLEFQTGLNPKTLLFGSVRWVPWSDFDVSPPLYTSTTGSPLAYFADDRITYRLGLGRKLNDTWSIFGEIGYEETTGSPTTNLTPVDGFTSATLGATYTRGNMTATLAARYADVGDAQTALGTTVPAAEFSDNSLWAVGVQVAFALD